MTTVYEYRQGRGEVKTIAALGPTTRADGTPLAVSEVSHYLMGISFNGGTVLDQAVALVDDVNTPEYDGEFDEKLIIDDQAPGTYVLTYKTVDTGGLESVPSESLTITVLPPLAPPNPPVVS